MVFLNKYLLSSPDLKVGVSNSKVRLYIMSFVPQQGMFFFVQEKVGTRIYFMLIYGKYITRGFADIF